MTLTELAAPLFEYVYGRQARATGELGVVIASTGPGTTNTMTGLFEASFASSPVLLVTGQIDSAYLGKAKGFLHEAEQQRLMLSSLCRRVETVRRTEDIGRAIMAVAGDIRSGRPILFSLGTLRSGARRAVSIVALAAIDVSGLGLTDGLRRDRMFGEPEGVDGGHPAERIGLAATGRRPGASSRCPRSRGCAARPATGPARSTSWPGGRTRRWPPRNGPGPTPSRQARVGSPRD